MAGRIPLTLQQVLRLVRRAPFENVPDTVVWNVQSTPFNNCSHFSADDEEGYLLLVKCAGAIDSRDHCPLWKGRKVLVDPTAETTIALSHIEVFTTMIASLDFKCARLCCSILDFSSHSLQHICQSLHMLQITNSHRVHRITSRVHQESIRFSWYCGTRGIVKAPCFRQRPLWVFAFGSFLRETGPRLCKTCLQTKVMVTKILGALWH